MHPARYVPGPEMDENCPYIHFGWLYTLHSKSSTFGWVFSLYLEWLRWSTIIQNWMVMFIQLWKNWKSSIFGRFLSSNFGWLHTTTKPSTIGWFMSSIFWWFIPLKDSFIIGRFLTSVVWMFVSSSVIKRNFTSISWCIACRWVP